MTQLTWSNFLFFLRLRFDSDFVPGSDFVSDFVSDFDFGFGADFVIVTLLLSPMANPDEFLITIGDTQT